MTCIDISPCLNHPDRNSGLLLQENRETTRTTRKTFYKTARALTQTRTQQSIINFKDDISDEIPYLRASVRMR